MDKNEQNSLIEYNTELQKDEKLVDSINQEAHKLNIIKAPLSVGFVLLILIIFFNTVHLSSIVFVVIVLIILNTFWPREKHITKFTNLRVILPSGKSVFWTEVFSLKKVSNNNGSYLALTLKPFVRENRLAVRNNEITTKHDSHIAIGGDYNIEFVNKITPHWEKNSPNSKLEVINQKLIDKYNLSNTRRRNRLVVHKGEFDDYYFNYSQSNQFPIQHLNAHFDFKRPIVAYLLITKEVLASKVKKIVGQNDIQTGMAFLDEKLFIKGSHEDLIEQLFDSDTKSRIKRLMEFGSLEVSFGKISEKAKLPSKKQKSKDNEQILDLQLIDSIKPSDILELYEADSTLELKMINLKKEIINEENMELIAEDFSTVALHFANGLNSIR